MKKMTALEEQLNNPLHGLKLEQLLTEVVEHYGFEILAEYTRINCFKNNPSMASSLKFLRKTEWAREKLERFYLYQFKNLPKASDEQYEITPRKRIIPAHQKPRQPQVLVLGQAPEPKIRTSSHQQTSRPFKSSAKKSTKQEKTSKPTNPWAAYEE